VAVFPSFLDRQISAENVTVFGISAKTARILDILLSLERSITHTEHFSRDQHGGVVEFSFLE
jgi:hypothetical protein